MTSVAVPSEHATILTGFADFARVDATRLVTRERRAALGQFFTPGPVARLMASLSKVRGGRNRLLDPGAGVGALTAAWVANACDATERPDRIDVTAYEIDRALLPLLDHVLGQCELHARAQGVSLSYEIRNEDFIRSGVTSLNGGLFGTQWPAFDAAILNPPYRKFRTDSAERLLLREIGLETGNLYAAFVALSLRALRTGGELIAITPRSFCNGPYFAPFRKDLLARASLTHLHVFDTRDVAFGDDDVLQENIIFRAERDQKQNSTVVVEWSGAGDAADVSRREVPFTDVVRSDDRDAFIHIAPDDWGARVAEIVRALKGTLPELGLQVSTGRVVDFRVQRYLRASPGDDTAPLIYPTHMAAGRIRWPKPESKKPNAIVRTAAVEDQLCITGTYVLVKRFSSKEEPRRLVAALFTPEAAEGEVVGFENHLNFFHARRRGISRRLALGLTAYLNSTLVDTYFRQFNGHTQVNAADLRKLPYPLAEQLERIADDLGEHEYDQSELDEVVEGELLSMPAKKRGTGVARHRIDEAADVLTALGLPKEQTNERAALTLLALLDLSPKQSWSEATNPLRGVTPIMEFAAKRYGKHWKPNTRETVRRFTLHQFQDAGLVVPNPDRPTRPINSPDYCYQIPEPALELLRSFGSRRWGTALRSYLASTETLKAKYAGDRQMKRIALRMGDGTEIKLSPGGQNELIRQVVHEFCPRFAPGATPLYIGDADRKWAHFDQAALDALNVRVDAHGKMPDVVVHFTEKNWLVLIEAVTSHGPVNPKRRRELKKLFAASSAPLVFVTAFLNRQALNKYLPDIAWETEVWVADAPSHIIHFNGERFLGPYE
jgi:adenine-specific DNA-methyltransferase